MTTTLILVCNRCSLRIRNLAAADIPPRGIVCRCGNRILPGEAKPDTRKRRPPAPKDGPGTELKRLLTELRLTGVKGCGCESKAAQMNRWGTEGCRERFGQIVAWLREARGKATWSATLTAAAAAVTTGLAAKIDPLNIEESLIRIAIERAEQSSTCPLAKW